MPKFSIPSSHVGRHSPGLLPVFTLVLRCSSLAIGIFGFLVHLTLQAIPVPQPPIQAELLNVQTVAARQPQVAANPPAAAANPPAAVQPPQLPPVAPPTAPPAFTQPVNTVPNPAPHVVHPRQAATTAPSSIIQLTFGEGEGQQPAPEYPDEAVVAGEEGTVVVRMTVDEDGRVTDAEVSAPCPWPILNSAAVRAVRDTWRFPRGPKRVYEVSIEFHLNKHEVQ